jgi:hypothetical protein
MVIGESKVMVLQEIDVICLISLVGGSQLENQHPALPDVYG